MATAPAPGNYAAVSNAAVHAAITNALQDAAIAGKADKSDVMPLLFAKYYPEGNVKSAAEFTAGVKYTLNPSNNTAIVRSFSNNANPDDPEYDNSSLVGRVVIPPFVDGSWNPLVQDDGTAYMVVAIGEEYIANAENSSLVSLVAPSTVLGVSGNAFEECTSLVSVSLPGVTNIGSYAFKSCYHLNSAYIPAARGIILRAFYGCTRLPSISLPSATTIEESAFEGCTSLASVDFGATPRPSVPSLGANAFLDVLTTTCKIIVPDAQYNEWKAAYRWSDLVSQGFKFLRHSEWEYARRYELDGKLDKSGGTMTGGIYLGDQDTYGYLCLAYDGENHRLVITDGWHENLAYLEVPNAYDGDRVAFTYDITAAISPTSPAFSNAVLSVGLGIDTNTVAVINELVDSSHDLPVTGATSVGALLLALAAAVAALKKKFGYDTEDSAASATIALSTRTFPVVDATAKTSADTIAVTMPSSAADGKVSDMCLRIDTGASVPALTFDLSTNVFIPASGDDAWGTLEASSHNVFSFTSSGTQTVAVTDAANGNAVTNVMKRVWIVGRVTAAIVAAETINES